MSHHASSIWENAGSVLSCICCINKIYRSHWRDTDGLQKVAEPVDTEQREPEKQDVPEQSQSESSHSDKSQVCNASSAQLVDNPSSVWKEIYLRHTELKALCQVLNI